MSDRFLKPDHFLCMTVLLNSVEGVVRLTRLYTGVEIGLVTAGLTFGPTIMMQLKNYMVKFTISYSTLLLNSARSSKVASIRVRWC